MKGLIQAEAPLSEKTAAKRQDSETKGAPLSGPLLGPHEEGPIAVETSVAMGQGWPILSVQLQDALQSPPREVLCELRESLGRFMWLQRTPTLPPSAPGPKPHDSAGPSRE